jgi:hypothetical protein
MASNDPNPPTVASFSPVTLSHATSANKQRSTILVHQKSPLLIATPPQITRALAYSHPFLLPLNKLAGLLTWTSGDPWESFLLVASFWGVVLYGDVVMRYGGPVVVVMGLILGMYSRRYSPLSSTGWTGEKQKKGHKKADSEITNTKHQKTLDEIVETLKIFTSRCNVLLDPLLELTDFLSTQRTATTATTRPALTILLIRILLVTPLWVVLTLRPIQIITTKRIALVTGTIFLTWHSRPASVSRAILWRSALVRRICSVVTGLHLTDTLTPPPPSTDKPGLPPRKPSYPETASLSASAAAKRRPDAPGVKFTFILYENQRRWVGLGWTYSLLAYERAPWTDEHLNTACIKEDFELPDVEGGAARWRWVEGSHWLVEGAAETDEGGAKAKEGADGGQGWIYYDNKVCCAILNFRNASATLGISRISLRASLIQPEGLNSLTLLANNMFSGKMVVEAKTAGAATPDAANGTATPNWLKSLPRLKSHPHQHPLATAVQRHQLTHLSQPFWPNHRQNTLTKSVSKTASKATNLGVTSLKVIMQAQRVLPIRPDLVRGEGEEQAVVIA